MRHNAIVVTGSYGDHLERAHPTQSPHMTSRLDERIAALEARIAALEARIQALEHAIHHPTPNWVIPANYSYIQCVQCGTYYPTGQTHACMRQT